MATSLYKIIGKAILLASMQFSIGSVEMSSKFSVMNFSKDQETLQRAANSLTHYMTIGMVWTVGTSLLAYSNYGTTGMWVNVAANAGIMLWIYLSYVVAFKHAAKQYSLAYPRMMALF